jgi:hypothetical protein
MADIIFPNEVPSETLGSSQLPSNVDIEFWRGDVQEYIIDMKNENGQAIDLTGYEPTAVIRASFTSPTQYPFTCTVQNTSQVRIYLPSTLSKTIPAGDYVWNFQLKHTASGDVRTYLAGDVTVYAEVDS